MGMEYTNRSPFLWLLEMCINRWQIKGALNCDRAPLLTGSSGGDALGAGYVPICLPGGFAGRRRRPAKSGGRWGAEAARPLLPATEGQGCRQANTAVTVVPLAVCFAVAERPLSFILRNYYGLYFCSVPCLLCETISYRQVTAAVFDTPLQEILLFKMQTKYLLHFETGDAMAEQRFLQNSPGRRVGFSV